MKKINLKEDAVKNFFVPEEMCFCPFPMDMKSEVYFFNGVSSVLFPLCCKKITVLHCLKIFRFNGETYEIIRICEQKSHIRKRQNM